MLADSPSGSRRILYWFQAAVARALFGIARMLPLDTASAVGGWLGRTIGPRFGKSKLARRNLARAFPEKSPAEIEAIVRGMWDNLGRTAFEYPNLDREPLMASGRVELRGVEHFEAMRDDGRSGILFSGHFANWEVMGLCSAEGGAPLNLIYRAPNNPFMSWLYHHRRSGEAEMIPKGSAGAKRALELLKGTAHLGMLVDQKMNDGIPVPFFGRDAMTAPALAQFAFRYECPVLPARIERTGGARFRLTVFPPMVFEKSGDRRADITNAMAAVNALIESWIRERPEQWLWVHRRWPD